MQEAEQTALKRENRKFKKHLTELASAVLAYLALLDAVMLEPQSNERGKKLGALAGQLEFANDKARFFGLGIDFRTDTARKAKAKAKALKEAM